MKKKLLSVLLVFTTLLSFAQEPSNAELLIHLKNIRADIIFFLEVLSEEQEYLRSYFGKESYLFLVNMLEEINTRVPAFLIRNEKEAEYIFSMICKMKDLEKPLECLTDSYYKPNNQECPANRDDVILSIVNKHHQAYCIQYPNHILSKMTVDDIYCLIFSNPCFCEQKTQVVKKILPKLEAKIKECETQI